MIVRFGFNPTATRTATYKFTWLDSNLGYLRATTMFRVITFIACVALSSCVRLHPLVVEQAHHDDYQAEKARDILKQVLGHTSEAYELKEGELGFSWKSCGSKSDPIGVNSLSVNPDPIVIPGNVNVSLDAAVAEDIVAPTALKLVIKKKLFGIFIEVPCVDNLGSCTYENPCSLLANITCPDVLKKQGINCRCPIKKKEYKLPPTLIAIPDIKLPSFIENGDYQIQATLLNGSKRLGCYNIVASLQTKSSILV